MGLSTRSDYLEFFQAITWSFFKPQTEAFHQCVGVDLSRESAPRSALSNDSLIALTLGHSASGHPERCTRSTPSFYPEYPD